MRLWALISLMCFSFPTMASVKIELATDPWCPYVCETEDSADGVLIEIAEKALIDSGYLVNYRWLSWARALKEVRNGKIQGIIGMYQSDAPDLVFGQEHLMLSNMCFYVQAEDDWHFSDISSLAQRQLSVVNSYSYGEVFDRYIKENTETATDHVHQMYGKDTLHKRIILMANGRFDTLIEDKLVVNLVNRSLAPTQRLKEAGCLSYQKVYIGFSTKSNLAQRLSRALDRGIKKLRESGELAEIIDKYH
jgi:polar amino acid transport system substrate-binding protein